MPAVDLGALRDKPSGEGKQEAIDVEVAFMVIIRPDGAIQASPDINAPIIPRRTVTLDEMQMASRKIFDDIQATKIAQTVQVTMQQTAMQAFNAAESQRIANGLKL